MYSSGVLVTYKYWIKATEGREEGMGEGGRWRAGRLAGWLAGFTLAQFEGIVFHGGEVMRAGSYGNAGTLFTSSFLFNQGPSSLRWYGPHSV